jgi:hypothetical protein
MKSLKIVLVLITIILIQLLPSGAHAITRGYDSSDKLLKPGMIVALVKTDGNTASSVERANVSNQDRIIGILTTVDANLVTVASENAEAYVENEGEVLAYVSDINGQVKKGDLLSVAPLEGMLMKATGSSRIIAIAQQDFTPERATSYPVSGADKKTTAVEKLMVNLDAQGLGSGGEKISSLSRTVRSITGRQVSDVRIIIALIVFFIIMVCEGAILYGAISSAITALGRNPLARQTIRGELLRVLLIVAAVLFVGLGSIYALLWL